MHLHSIWNQMSFVGNFAFGFATVFSSMNRLILSNRKIDKIRWWTIISNWLWLSGKKKFFFVEKVENNVGEWLKRVSVNGTQSMPFIWYLYSRFWHTKVDVIHIETQIINSRMKERQSGKIISGRIMCRKRKIYRPKAYSLFRVCNFHIRLFFEYTLMWYKRKVIYEQIHLIFMHILHCDLFDFFSSSFFFVFRFSFKFSLAQKYFPPFLSLCFVKRIKCETFLFLRALYCAYTHTNVLTEFSRLLWKNEYCEKKPYKIVTTTSFVDDVVDAIIQVSSIIRHLQERTSFQVYATSETKLVFIILCFDSNVNYVRE